MYNHLQQTKRPFTRSSPSDSLQLASAQLAKLLACLTGLGFLQPVNGRIEPQNAKGYPLSYGALTNHPFTAQKKTIRTSLKLQTLFSAPGSHCRVASSP